MVQEEPFFSIIIPTYNRREILGLTLQSLFSQDYTLDRFEVLVIVDGSTDGTQEMLQSLHFPYSLRIFDQRNQGPAAARNVGLRNAKGEIVLFLDDDTIATRNLLKVHARFHRSHKNLVVRGQYLIHPASPPSTAVENHQKEDCIYWSQLAAGLQFPEDAVCDANTSVSREFLNKAGEFDERFLFQRENVELGYRLYLQGGDFIYVPDAVVYHYLLKSGEDLVRDAYWRGKSDFLLIQKYPDYGGTRELNSFFNAGWLQTLVRFALWNFQELTKVFACLSNLWLSPLFPKLKATRSVLNRIGRFSAYSQGLRDAGASWKYLAKVLKKKKKSITAERF